MPAHPLSTYPYEPKTVNGVRILTTRAEVYDLSKHVGQSSES